MFLSHVFRRCLLVCLLLVTTAVAEDKPKQLGIREKHETADFANVVERVQELTQKHPPQKVLLVLDIDNTLLAMNQDLGSDQWFNWQEELLKTSPRSRDLVATDFPGLLAAQGLLFAMSQMHPPEPKLPDYIKQIQDSGVTCIVLTSRGPDFRDAAQRELARNGYNFAKQSLAIAEKCGPFKPYDIVTHKSHDLSPEEISSIATLPADVTFANGIFMTAGQHKGFMLRTLLDRAVLSEQDRHHRDFEAIVFVDDHQKHTDRMHAAYVAKKIDLVTFRYGREDGNVANFANSSKRHVVQQWNRLQRTMDEIFVLQKKAG